MGDIHVGAGNYHGFDETIVTGKRGRQEIYIYATDIGSNQDRSEERRVGKECRL